MALEGFTALATASNSDKQLWDWLELILIPLVLALAAFLFNEVQSDREHNREDREQAADQARLGAATQRDTLATYLRQMSDLVVDHDLARPNARRDVRVLARTLTLTALHDLNASGRGSVVRFLAEARLISVTDPKVDLAGADLRGAALQRAPLMNTRLQGANVAAANLYQATIQGADFRYTNLRRADLRYTFALPTLALRRDGTRVRYRPAAFDGASLVAARLEGAELQEATFYESDLRRAAFGGAHLNLAVFAEACLTDARFVESDLSGAQLNADGKNANFSGADLTGAHGRDPKAFFPAGWQRTGPTFSRRGESRRCPTLTTQVPRISITPP